MLGRNLRNLDVNSYEIDCRTCGHDSFSLVLIKTVKAITRPLDQIDGSKIIQFIRKKQFVQEVKPFVQPVFQCLMEHSSIIFLTASIIFADLKVEKLN